MPSAYKSAVDHLRRIAIHLFPRHRCHGIVDQGTRKGTEAEATEKFDRLCGQFAFGDRTLRIDHMEIKRVGRESHSM